MSYPGGSLDDSSAGLPITLVSPPASTNAANDTALTFAFRLRHVIIQNNTAAALYCDFDTAATQGGFAVYPGGQMAVFDVPCSVLHLWTAAAQAINGVAAGGIVVRGWA